jgi:pimeloyl-ACP methyl ester carboxylesterase
MKIEQFKINIGQEVLDDLKIRLEMTRWPDEISQSGWDYGTNLDFMKELVDYWIKTYDWRKAENYLNSFNQYKINIQGTKIHFIHVKGKGNNPFPIIITHGWPSSFYQMLKMIDPLTNPEKYGGSEKDSFSVVVPSLPGFGFSDTILKRGRINVASYWNTLMVEGLGYEKFFAQGGDIGSGITATLGRDYPENVMAIHLTDTFSNINLQTPNITEEEKKYLLNIKNWEEWEGAYEKIQGTKPQTLAFGLNDSPVGLAAWIIEKFYAWSDHNGDLYQVFTKDDLLTNVMIYWITQTINGSMRYYYEYQHELNPRNNWNFAVPTGISLFPKDIDQFPIEYAKRSYNVQKFSIMKKGGHFAALEQDRVLIEELRSFFRLYR